jgi:cytochrome b561
VKAFPPPRVVEAYHPILRAIHWLMALAILAAIALGVWATQLPRGDFRSEILFVHKSLGVTVFALVALRIVVRLVVGAPRYAEPLGRLTHAAASTAHLALYALMIAMPVSGYIFSSAAGREVPWFGVFAVPSFISEDKGLARSAAEAHFVLAWIIGVTLAVHIAAVVWHARVRRDTVLTRMWPRFRLEPAR